MTSLNLQITELGTPRVGDLSIIWDEIGLWEPIGMKKNLEIFERNSHLFAFMDLNKYLSNIL